MQVAANLGPNDRALSKEGGQGYAFALGVQPWNVTFDGNGNGDRQVIDFVGTSDEWTHLAVVMDRDGEVATVFFNGVPGDQATVGTLGEINNSNPFSLGGDVNASFDGRIDEVRVSFDAREPAELAMHHANLTDANFLAVSDEELPPAP